MIHMEWISILLVVFVMYLLIDGFAILFYQLMMSGTGMQMSWWNCIKFTSAALAIIFGAFATLVGSMYLLASLLI